MQCVSTEDCTRNIRDLNCNDSKIVFFSSKVNNQNHDKIVLKIESIEPKYMVMLHWFDVLCF